jgi:hypothetical protein
MPERRPFKPRVNAEGATAIRTGEKGENFVLGIPQDAPPGSPNDQMMRSRYERKGLPGSTPVIDPRLVNPSNNPMTSHEGMARGDINLDTGEEDRLGPLLAYLEAMMKRGVVNPHPMDKSLWEPTFNK